MTPVVDPEPDAQTRGGRASGWSGRRLREDEELPAATAPPVRRETV